MEDSLPLPVPPRTPTPISDDEHDLPTTSRPGQGLGIKGVYSSPIISRLTFDQSSSPPSDTTGSASSARTDMLSPSSIVASSPNDFYSPITPQSVTSESSAFYMADAKPSPGNNPFNFTPQQYTVGKPPTATRPVSRIPRPQHHTLTITRSPESAEAIPTSAVVSISVRA